MEEDLKFLHEQVTEFWKLVKRNYPVRSHFDMKYWDTVHDDVEAFAKKYPKDNLGYHLVIGYLGYLQNAPHKEV